MFLFALLLLNAGVQAPTSVASWNAPLPSPIKIADQSDATADMLARDVAAGDASSMPALLAAVKACGWSVVDGKGKILVGPFAAPGMGLSLEDADVKLLCIPNPNRPSLKLSDVANAYQSVFPKETSAQIQQGILDSLKADLTSKNSNVRFWAHFINDLGIYGQTNPYVLQIQKSELGAQLEAKLAKTPLAGRSLTEIQQSNSNVQSKLSSIQDLTQQMIAAAKAGDKAKIEQLKAQIRDAAQAMKQAATELKSGTTPSGGPLGGKPVGGKDPTDVPLTMVQAQFIGRRFGADIIGRALKAYNAASGKSQIEEHGPALDNPPPKDYTGVILDLNAAIMCEGFSQVLDELKELGFDTGGIINPENMEKFSAASGIGNLALAYIKLLATYNLISMTLTPSTLKLVRDQGKKQGNPSGLTFHVEIKNPIGAINAARPVFHFAGTDIPLPDDGPIKNAGVDWKLEEPKIETSQTTQSVPDYSIAFSQNATIHNHTDADGNATNSVSTTPQKVALPANSTKFSRHANIVIGCQIKSQDILQDSVDAFQTVLNAKGSVPLTVAATLPEMLYRSNLLSTKQWGIDIDDWKTPAWEGTFTLSIKGNASKSEQFMQASWKVDRSCKGTLGYKPYADVISAEMPKLPIGQFAASYTSYSVSDRVSKRTFLPEQPVISHLESYIGPVTQSALQADDIFFGMNGGGMTGQKPTFDTLGKVGGAGEIELKFNDDGTWDVTGKFAAEPMVRHRAVDLNQPGETSNSVTYDTADIPYSFGQYKQKFPGDSKSITGNIDVPQEITIYGLPGTVTISLHFELHLAASGSHL